MSLNFKFCKSYRSWALHWSIQVPTWPACACVLSELETAGGATCCWVQTPRDMHSLNSSAGSCGGLWYLHILPAESLDVPELSLVSCAQVFRGAETSCGLRQGLRSLFTVLIWGCMESCSSWRCSSLLLLIYPAFWPSSYKVIQRGGSATSSPRWCYERLGERRGTSSEGTEPSRAHSC